MPRLVFDSAYTASFYDAYGDRESARWQTGPRGRMQHAIYGHHVRERVRIGDRVLDAGCGPGIFTKLLLDIGARVTCLDLSQVQIDACRAYAPGAEGYQIGSITDLGRFQDASFDVTLAFGGPLSYCFEAAGDAARELVRVTRPGGAIGLSAMSLQGTIHRFMTGVLELPIGVTERILATGDLDRETNDGHECHLFRVEELRALLRDAGFEHLELFASGWLIPNDDVEGPQVGTDLWNLLLEAELRASAESPGAGTHIIAWGRAPGVSR